MQNSGCQLTAYRLHEHDTFLKIVPAPADRFWMDFTTHGWANRCLPLRIANQAGWHILNNSKFEVEWNGKADVDAVTIHFLDGRPSRFVKSNFGYGILTWYLPYLFRTSAGYNLLVRGPANLPKDGISAIEGLVETDWGGRNLQRQLEDHPAVHENPLRRRRSHLPARPAAPHRTGVHRAIHPQPRVKLRATRRIYTRGTHVSGEATPKHQNKLQLKSFEEIEPPL